MPLENQNELQFPASWLNFAAPGLSDERGRWVPCYLLSAPLCVSIIGDKGTEKPRSWIPTVIKHGTVTNLNVVHYRKTSTLFVSPNTALLNWNSDTEDWRWYQVREYPAHLHSCTCPAPNRSSAKIPTTTSSVNSCSHTWRSGNSGCRPALSTGARTYFSGTALQPILEDVILLLSR